MNKGAWCHLFKCKEWVALRDAWPKFDARAVVMKVTVPAQKSWYVAALIDSLIEHQPGMPATPTRHRALHLLVYCALQVASACSHRDELDAIARSRAMGIEGDHSELRCEFVRPRPDQRIGGLNGQVGVSQGSLEVTVDVELEPAGQQTQLALRAAGETYKQSSKATDVSFEGVRIPEGLQTLSLTCTRGDETVKRTLQLDVDTTPCGASVKSPAADSSIRLSDDESASRDGVQVLLEVELSDRDCTEFRTGLCPLQAGSPAFIPSAQLSSRLLTLGADGAQSICVETRDEAGNVGTLQTSFELRDCVAKPSVEACGPECVDCSGATLGRNEQHICDHGECKVACKDGFHRELNGLCEYRPGCSGLIDACGDADDCCGADRIPALPASALSFSRGYDASHQTEAIAGAQKLPDPVTVSAFALDRYEVTVGRFSVFVEQYDGWIGGGNGWSAGFGAHPRIAGSGLNPAWRNVAVARLTDGQLETLIPTSKEQLVDRISSCEPSTCGTCQQV
jgi:hypothetical protein